VVDYEGNCRLWQQNLVAHWGAVAIAATGDLSLLARAAQRASSTGACGFQRFGGDPVRFGWSKA